jgi:CRISPR-associated protein Csm2
MATTLQPLSKRLKPEKFCREDGDAHQTAKKFLEKHKVAQIRKVFGVIKEIHRELRSSKPEDKIPATTKNKLLLVVPQLAYAYGRDLIPKEFYTEMKGYLSDDSLVTVEDFDVLVEYLTAVLAYQKMEEKKG